MKNLSTSPTAPDKIPQPKILLAGLLVACPYQAGREACILYHIRKKPLAWRVKWLHQLTDDEICNLLKRHEHCLIKTEGDSHSIGTDGTALNPADG